MAEYSFAPPVIITTAESLIETYHQHLKKEKIAYLIKHGTWKKNGKPVLCDAKKCSNKDELLTSYNFVITFSDEILNFTPAYQKAVIDHALSHCKVEFDDYGRVIKRYIAGHDLEDFADVIRKHGLYTDEVNEFFRKTEQISFFESRETNLKVVK